MRHKGMQFWSKFAVSKCTFFCAKWLIIFGKIGKSIKFFSIILQICFSNPIHLISSILQRAILTQKFRSSHKELSLGKGALKIYSKFTEEHPCWSAISIKLQTNFIEIALWHGCSPVNLLHVFRTTVLKNTSGWLLLKIFTSLLILLFLLYNCDKNKLYIQTLTI